VKYEIIFSEDALDDLYGIDQWILREAGAAIADAYYARLEVRLYSLQDFPNRGTPRADFGPGVRSVPFERTVTVYYSVEDRSVVILRVLHGAREVGLLN